MSLVDMLFEGPVKVMDLDHDQYAEAASLLRRKIIVLKKEDDTIRLTLSGRRKLVAEMLRGLKDSGLVQQVGDGFTITSEGALLFEGNGQVM